MQHSFLFPLNLIRADASSWSSSEDDEQNDVKIVREIKNNFHGGGGGGGEGAKTLNGSSCRDDSKSSDKIQHAERA